MTEQFLRNWSLQIGTRLIRPRADRHALRIAFSVERDETRYPNNCEIAVWNLAEETRHELDRSAENVTTILEAGYRDDVQQIFVGTLRRIEHVKEGPNVITRVSAGDGEEKIAVSRVAQTFVKGTTLQAVLKELIKALGIPEGNFKYLSQLKDATGGTKLARALSFAGPASDALSQFCASVGILWSVQDGEMRFRFAGSPSGDVAPLITPDTGLVGIPRIETSKDKAHKGQQVLSGTALILPGLVPGAAFVLRSAEISGNFIALTTKHYGDTAGKEWYVDFTASEIERPAPPPYVGL